MKKYVCDVCGYVYDPEKGDPDSGIEPGTAFEDIPEDWVCPLCGVGKDSIVTAQWRIFYAMPVSVYRGRYIVACQR